MKADLASVTGSGGRGRHAGRFSRLDHQRAGKDAYPIASFTWLLIP